MKSTLDKFKLIWRTIFIHASPPKFSSLRTHLTQLEESDGDKKLEKFFNTAIIESQSQQRVFESQLMNNSITVSCTYCGKSGHSKSDCRKFKREHKRND